MESSDWTLQNERSESFDWKGKDKKISEKVRPRSVVQSGASLKVDDHFRREKENNSNDYRLANKFKTMMFVL